MAPASTIEGQGPGQCDPVGRTGPPGKGHGRRHPGIVTCLPVIDRPVILDRVHPAGEATGLTEKGCRCRFDQQGRNAVCCRMDGRRGPSGAGANNEKRTARPNQTFEQGAVNRHPSAYHLVPDADRGEATSNVNEERMDKVGKQKGICHTLFSRLQGICGPAAFQQLFEVLFGETVHRIDVGSEIRRTTPRLVERWGQRFGQV